MSTLPLPANYARALEDLKAKVRSSQIRAVLSANSELIHLYFEIGHYLTEQGRQWGSKVVEHLARDLRAEFPDMSGFSRTNLFYMRKLHQAWADAPETVQQLVGLIPWGHHITLVTKVDDPTERAFYLRHIIEYGWSRAVLVAQLETDLYAREGGAPNNFDRTLPHPQSDLARQTIKDPYIFDFLTLSKEAHERELEQGLVEHIQRFLIELGVGFAFVGRQYHLEVQGRDFYLDLLFYHLDLRCFIVVELKAGEFQPEHTGKLNFYLSAVDDLLRHESDNPSIGLLLCKSKDHVMVEYALRESKRPMGVSEWRTRLVESLPKKFKGTLPSIEEIEAELSGKD